MRFFLGFIAFWIWIIFLCWVAANSNFVFSNDAVLISLAIVVAGAMAGGE